MCTMRSWAGLRLAAVIFASIWSLGCASKPEESAPAPAAPSAAEPAPPPAESAPEPTPTDETQAPQAPTAPAEPVKEDEAPLVLLAELDAGGYQAAKCLAVAPDGETFFVAGRALSAWKFGRTEPEFTREDFLEDLGLDHKVEGIALSANGDVAALGCGDGTLRIWNLAKEKLVAKVDAHPGGVTAVAMRADGTIATVGRDDRVRLWNALDGQIVDAWQVQDRSLAGVAFSPNGKTLAACGEHAYLWDLGGEFEERRLTQGLVRVADVDFSPDGKQVACARMAWDLRIFDAHTGEQVASLEGHEGPLRRVAYRPDGRRIASAGEEYTVRIFDLGSNRLVQTISTETELGTETPNDIAWSRDGKRLVVVTDEGKIRIWGSPEEKGSPESTPPAEVAHAPAPRAEPPPAEGPTAAEPPPERPADDAPPAAPAHVVEAGDVLDLSKLPWPEGTDGANDDVTQLSYEGPGDLEACREFYRKWFADAGWRDVTPEGQSGEGFDFEKDGFRVACTILESPHKNGDVMIRILNHGNVDARRLPKPDSVAETVLERPTFAMYFAKGSVEQTADFYRRELPKLGWRLTRTIDAAGVRTDWVQNGVHLLVSVMSAPARGGQTAVQCSVDMVREELPIPADAQIEDYRDYPDARIKLTTKGDAPSTAEYLEREMQVLRWQRVDERRIGPEGGSMVFKRGPQIAEFLLKPLADGGTSASLKALRAASKEVLAAAERAAARDKAREMEAKETAKKALEDAIPTADFPVPEDAADVQRGEFSKDVQYKCKGTVEELLAFHREKLAGWSEDGKEAMLQKDFGQAVFTKAAATIRIRVVATADAGVYRVYIDGTGLRLPNE